MRASWTSEGPPRWGLVAPRGGGIWPGCVSSWCRRLTDSPDGSPRLEGWVGGEGGEGVGIPPCRRNTFGDASISRNAAGSGVACRRSLSQCMIEEFDRAAELATEEAHLSSSRPHQVTNTYRGAGQTKGSSPSDWAASGDPVCDWPRPLMDHAP
ncbi:unnamed protein product [Arctogadus glacialis]